MLFNAESKIKSLFYGIEFTNGIRRQIVDALGIIYFISLGHNIVTITTIFAISRLIMVLFEFPSGAFADHYSRKKSILLSFGLMTLAFLGIYFSQNLFWIALFYILHDIAWTFQSGTITAWVIDELNYGEHSKKLASIFARFFFFEKSGAIIGGLLGLILVSINFKLIWLVISFANLLAFIIIFFYMQENNFKPKDFDKKIFLNTYIQAKDSIKYLFKKDNKQLKGLAMATFFGSIAIDSFFIEVPLILNKILEIPPNMISGIMMLVAILTLIAPFLGEKLAHRFGSLKPLFGIHIGITIFIISYAVSTNLIFSIILLVLFNVFETASITINDSAVQYNIPSENRATLGSAINVIWSIATSLSALFVGIGIHHLGLENTTLISGIIVLFTSFIYLFSLKK